MDLIDSILGTLRTAAPLLGRQQLGDGVSLAMRSRGGVPFLYAIAGEYRLVVGKTRVTIGAGDFVLLPRGPAFRLEVGRPAETTHMVELVRARGLPAWSEQGGLGRPIMMEVGADPVAATILSGRATFGDPRSDLLLPHLPEIIVDRRVGGSMAQWLSAAEGFIAEEHETHPPGYAAVACRVTELLLIVAIRNWLLENAQDNGWLRGLSDPVVSRALTLMQERPHHPWRLATLAAAAGCSRARLAKRFRDAVGVPPFAYLTRLRMLQAAKTLVETRKSVEAIGTETGYASAFAFSRAFAETMGETPSKYRRARLHAGRQAGGQPT